MFRLTVFLIGFLWSFSQALAEAVDVTQLEDAPATMENRMQQVSVSDCPQVSVRTVDKCQNLALIPEAVANYGFMAEPRWFLFSLTNPSQANRKVYVEIDYALLDNIQFFVLDDKGRILTSYITGDKMPFSSRPIDYPTFVFPVSVEPDTRVEVRFLVETGSSLQVPVIIWHPEDFVAAKSNQLMLFGLFVGAMLIMGVYNGLLYLSTKDKSYLFFSSTLFFYALCQGDLTGVSFQFLWPDAVDWNDKSLIVVSGLALISLCFGSPARFYAWMRTVPIRTGW